MANVKAATVSDSRLETYSLYYLLYFFFRLTTVVPITAPPLMNRSATHKCVLFILYPTHYVKMCSRCSILLSHSLLESAHSFNSFSTSVFIGKFFL